MSRQVFDDELKQLIPLDQAISESVFQTQFSEMKKEFKEDVKDQKNLSLQIIIGVCVAFIFIVGGAMLSVVQSHQDDSQALVDLQRDFDSKILEMTNVQNQINQTLIQKIDEMRPYCSNK